jgi:hypothetical protein
MSSQYVKKWYFGLFDVIFVMSEISLDPIKPKSGKYSALVEFDGKFWYIWEGDPVPFSEIGGMFFFPQGLDIASKNLDV